MVLQNSRRRISGTTLPLSTAIRMHVACCFLVSAGSIVPQQAWAQAGQPAKDYSIAGGKLNQALAVFAVKAGISLAYDAALVQDKYSPGLAGRYPVAEALARLLNGTGLEAAAKAEGGYMLRAAPPPALPVASAAAVAEKAAAREDPPLMAVTVTGTTGAPEPTQGFAAASSNSAARGDTPLSEIAQSVQVVTKDVMASQQAQSLLDALHDVSGVNIYNRGVDSAIYIRGFTAPSRINGLEQGPSPIDNASSPLHTPLAAIERIDVLKGADSIIANGQMQPGGLANIITKRPQAEALRELTLEAGSYGHQRMTLDLAGALSDDQAWTHRLILSGNRDPNATGRYDSEREVYAAPSLGYRHGDTTAVAGLSYQRNQHASGGFGPLGAVDDGTRSTSIGASYDWQQKLGGGWSWQSKGNYMKTQVSFESYYCKQSKADSSGAAMRGCQPQAGEATSYGWNVENSVRSSFFTGSVKHVVLAGVAFHHSWLAAPQIEIGDSVMASLSADSLPEVSQSSLAPSPGLSSQSYHTSNWFLQDQLSWRRWHLLANLGYTKAWLHSIDAQTGDDTALHPRSKPVYNIGLAYQLTDSMTVYVNQQKSFVLQAQASGPGPNGGPMGIYNFPSTEGKSIEAGLKLNLFDERLLLTASAFRATHSKVLYGAVDDAGVTRLLGSLPPTVSYGTELDVAGSPAPGWNLIASYSYTGFKAGQPSDFSFAVDRVARHQASFWSSYDLQSPGWRGWGYGLGMSSRGGYRNINDAYMGGQFSTDANLRYKSRLWSLTLGMRNIFDRKLYGSFASIPEGSGFEQGRTVVLTGRYNF